MQLPNDPCSKLARLCFAGVLTATTLALTLPASAAPASTRPANPQEQLDRAFAILQQADSQIPPHSYDPVAVVQNLGGRLDDLFAWVRDNTRWAPYRGALRGPAGVLIDRMGNSLDRSLLLAEFYHHTPAKFRLAHAPLSAEQAKALFEKLRTAPRPVGISFETRDGAGPMGIAAAQRLDRLGDGLTQRAAAETAMLSAVMGLSRPPAGSADDVSLASLSDHWWLQRSDGDRWVDLDVTLPGAKPGDTVCPATETFPLDGLAKDLWHTLRIAVVAERWADGKLSQSTVLSRTVRPGLVVGGTIYLTHVPLEWAHDPSAGTSAEAVKAARAQALIPTEWVPTLKLGIETANDAGIRPDGSVDPKPQLDATARLGMGMNKSAVSAIDALDTPPATRAASAAPAGVFTAEWVEYTVHTPGIPDETIRRDVFDLIGPAARAAGVSERPATDELARANAALALRGRIDIVALPCQLSPAFVSHTLLQSLVNSKSALLQALAAMQQPGGAEAEFDVPPPCPSPLYGLALLRRLYSPTAADWFIARPNVFTYHSFARLTPDGHQDYCEATDLVTNDVAIEPWSKADPAKLRRDQGVLDTAAEGALLPIGGERVSASETLAAAASQSLEWVAARAPADLDRVKATPDDMARLRAAVLSGRIVVVPSAPVRLGTHDSIAWWEIDPATGRTLGIGQQGWGTDMAEYAAIIQRWVMAHKRFVCLGAAATTVLNVISPLFGLNELQGDALSAVQTALDAACAGA
jgi:hypothetical protein